MSNDGNAEDLGAWRDGYVLWNQRLLESFFSPASSGEEVWLQVDQEELDSIGRDLGGDEGLLKAVKAGPPWGTIVRGGQYVHGQAGDLVARIRGLETQRWQLRRRPQGYCDPGDLSPLYANRSAPTYLPYLAALVRSAASAGRAGFYSHLRESLGLQPTWGTQNLVAMEHAWDDLQTWTKETSGQFGRFVFRTLGGYERIGVPRSQYIMSRRDKDNLPRVFGQIGVGRTQQLNPRLVADIKQVIADSLEFSSQFREAVAISAFDELVHERIKAVFADWDGKTPSGGGHRPGGRVAIDEAACEVVEVCLSLSDGNVVPWLLHWRAPALVGSGSVFLDHGETQWEAPVLGSEPATTIHDDSDSSQSAAREILTCSEAVEVKFKASTLTADGSIEVLDEVVLPNEILRVLVWRFDSVHQRHELRESTLPAHGPAYLLATKANADRLSDYVARQDLRHQTMEATGLPPGWVLECLLDCSQLTDEQRSTLPDGKAGRSSPRVVRLVGGRSVSRANIRQYMWYDLPYVEVDAPEGTTLRADGLAFSEEDRGDGPASAIRRFHVSQNSSGPRLYEIIASCNGTQLGSARLRVAASSGEGTYSNGDGFSIDPKGWPDRSSGGMRGVLPSPGLPAVDGGTELFAKETHEFGQVVALAGVERVQSRPAAMFLDTLAQKGSMAYGPARDQLARLLARAGHRADTGAVLHELRGRGHLEIEIDAEGHMARVYAVEPTLYELAATQGELPTYGVLGSLSLQQWQALADAAGIGTTYNLISAGSALESWRLLPSAIDSIAGIAHQAGFVLSKQPALQIAQWAALASNVRASIEELAQECPPGTGVSAEEFAAASGVFHKLSRQVRVDDGLECQLFRMPDINAESLKVYILGINGASGRRYGYVRDSSWGKWVALGAFARYIKDLYGIEDASPWPIPYSEIDGTVWLPARLKLPFVLERALTLCSGAPPLVTKVEGMPGKNGIELSRQPDGLRLGCVSMVYQKMAEEIPLIGFPLWLGFQWVPRKVADEVARKIGGLIAPT